MKIVKKVKEYDEVTRCNYELNKQKYFTHISGFSVSVMLSLLKTPMKGYIKGQMAKIFNIDFLRNFEYQDPPMDLPLVQYDNVTSDSPIDLHTLLTEKYNWPYRTIYDYVHAYKSKTVTPTKIVTKLLELMESDPIMSLFIISECDKEYLLIDTHESTHRHNSGTTKSILDGVPYMIKEIIGMKHIMCHLGSDDCNILPNNTATVVSKLNDMGCIMIATTTMSSLGYNSVGYNISKTFPTPCNPWSSTKYPGGTSSGSAVAVACGLVPFALGIDTFGSIRIPSSYMGLVGLKSTLTRVSNYGVLISDEAQSLCGVGPITTCVEDASLIYSVLSGPDEKYPYGMSQPPPTAPQLKEFDIKSVRFGLCNEYIKGADKIQIDCLNIVCEKLKEKKAIILDIGISELRESSSYCIYILIKAASKLPILCNSHDIISKSNDISVIGAYLLSDCFTDEDMMKIKQQRTRSVDIMKRLFENVDILILPTTCTVAPDKFQSDGKNGFINKNLITASSFFTSLASFTGLPAVCLNVGYEPNTNMPVSIQLISKWWSEDFLLSVANCIEEMFPLTRKPKILVDPLL